MKPSKQDQYIESAKEICAYVNTEEKIIGVYSTLEDCVVADKSLAVKRLKRYFHYKIQMVIK